MTKGDSGMYEEARTGYWKELQIIKKVRSRIEKIRGWGWMHICIFYLHIAVVRDKESRKSLKWDSARV